MNHSEIEELKKALLSRDNSILGEIYYKYKLDCTRILKSKQLSPLDKVEDLYTDAILVLRKNIISGKLTELTNPLSYLVSICGNLAKYERRKEMTKLTKEQQVLSQFYKDETESNENLNQKNKLIEKCKNALSRLTQRCQQIIIAYYVHGLKMKEIAEELELSSGDVAKTLKSRCYKSWMATVKELDR